MKFDFSMVEAAPEYGGGMTAEQAKQEWIREYNELSLKSDLPVFVWPWHDYGPTQWVVNEVPTSPYTKEMYTEFLRYAYQQDAEFVTLLDLAQRIKAFEKAGFNYSFDSPATPSQPWSRPIRSAPSLSIWKRANHCERRRLVRL